MIENLLKRRNILCFFIEVIPIGFSESMVADATHVLISLRDLPHDFVSHRTSKGLVDALSTLDEVFVVRAILYKFIKLTSHLWVHLKTFLLSGLLFCEVDYRPPQIYDPKRKNVGYA